MERIVIFEDSNIKTIQPQCPSKVFRKKADTISIASDFIKASIPNTYKQVIYYIGFNDISQESNGASKIFGDFETLIRKTKKRHKKTKITIISLPQPCGTELMEIELLNNALEELCRRDRRVNFVNNIITNHPKAWKMSDTQQDQSWWYCPRMGEILAGKFFPFKTPCANYTNEVPQERRFYPAMLFVELGLLEQQVGLIIDLTNSKKYYNSEHVTKQNIEYFKIRCKGYKVSPTPEETSTFIEKCSNFFSHNPQKSIGVHCTHGFNRTGFLIAAYLVEKMGWRIGAALEAFADTRPPGIYRQNNIVELFSRYGKKEDAPAPPELPDWCNV